MAQDRPSSTYGHLAMQYRTNEDAPLAARLLREIGFKECYSIPSTASGPYSGPFHHFVSDFARKASAVSDAKKRTRKPAAKRFRR